MSPGHGRMRDKVEIERENKAEEMRKSGRSRSGHDAVIDLGWVEVVEDRTAKERVRLHMRLGYAVIKVLVGYLYL